MLETDYQIILIIITIIGFIISTAFYVYFVYLPATRAEDQLDIITAQGEDLITLINDRTSEIEQNTIENLRNTCEAISNLICSYNTKLIFFNIIYPPCDSGGKCALDTRAYPAFCNQFAPFPQNPCDCVITS